MITIRTFDNQAEAAFYVSLLHAGGFDPVLLDEASHTSSYPGVVPIRMQVPDEQANDAAAYLVKAQSTAPGLQSTGDTSPPSKSGAL